MSWASLSLVTDADLGALEPEATASTRPWGQVTWAAARATAKRDLKVWLEIAYPDVIGVADRVLDRWPADWVFSYISSVYADVTSALRNDLEEDVSASAVFATVGTDRLYLGAAWAFDGVLLKLLDSLNAVASVLTAKYWGPTGWTSLGATDGTIAVTGKTLSGTGRVTWTMPSDWERRTLNGTGDEYYWVELSVTATPTAGTMLTQAVPIRAPDGLKTVASYLTMATIFKGLAAQSAVPQSWLDRGKDYETKARTLFDTLKAAGLLPIDVSRDQAIEASEVGSGSAHAVGLYRG